MKPRALLAGLVAFALVTASAAAGAATTPKHLEQARQALHSWKLDDAAKLLKRRVPASAAVEREVLLARLDLQRSRFDAVDKRLTPVVDKHPEAYEARVVLGRALYARGQKQRAFQVLDQMASDYNDGRVTEPEELMWLGVGLHLTDYPKNANQIFGDALKADPKLHRARLLWAELFIDKYNFRDSDELYKEVLAKRPNDPEALLGRARIDVESDRAFTKAKKKLEKLLEVAPKMVPAHNLLARIDLDHERPQDAIDRLVKHSLKVAPDDPEATILLAAAYYVDDDRADFEKTERRALKINPKFAAFYSEVSQHAQRVHRYKDAIKLNEKALALDPEHWQALANLGMGYSRVGDDEKARDYLNRAFEGDPYDVRTYNLLEFFYDRVIKQFQWVDVGPMKVRLHNTERDVLERYVPELLDEAYKFLVKKYGYTPEQPLHIEIFPDPQLFAVRSVGLPNLGAHGICFGHVVTARSPKPGNFNWAEVLWHELSHVFHIQLSNSRVPRWFTEGMAVYESTEARAEWRREMDEDLLAYLDADKLRGIGDFNLSFTQAKSFKDILVAYYHAYVVTDFIAREFGFPKMRKMLVAWGKKKQTPEVFEDVLGVTLAEFDKRFFAWLDKKLAPLRANFTLDPLPYKADADAWIAKAAKAPKDAKAQADAAMAYLAKKDHEKALAAADAALRLDPKQPTALLLKASHAFIKGKMDEAKAGFETLLAEGKDGMDIRLPLAKLASEAGDHATAARHLERAIAMNPKAGALYYKLIEALDAKGDKKAAFAWRKKALLIDQANVRLVGELLDASEAMGAAPAEVRHWGEVGNHVAPFDIEHHLRFAKQLIRIGDAKRADYELATALILDPNNAEAQKLKGR